MSSDPSFDFIVLTPPGRPDPRLAIAGSRAGALGVINLEFAADPTTALDALAELGAHGRGRLGVLLNPEAEAHCDAILGQSRVDLRVIMLTPAAPAPLGRAVATAHNSGRQAYVVATSLEEARVAHEAGADAIVARGHEAAGWVGEETAFVLLQRLLPRIDLPIWVQGGIGLHTAAACAVAGAAGAVLDNQLLLTRESPLSAGARARIGAMDGSETACLGTSLGAPFRAYARPGLPGVDELRRVETTLTRSTQDPEAAREAWRAELCQRVGWEQPETQILVVGQDAAFAGEFARRFSTVGGVLAGLRQSIEEHRAGAEQHAALAEGAPLAQSHGTRYPIVQGPMTRVSDRAEFAAAVAEAGALPFLALALMRAPEVRTLLEDTKRQLGERPWGVGILGFVPPELRAEQLEVIRAYPPAFALIAGGRPDQARVLENDGIPTYLHVPSPGLLEMFLQDGARRFVFEGRECGGHVGPRTSFVLWETMVGVLLEHLKAGGDAAEYHVLFAGGIHDGLSGAMVAALAAPLSERGVRIGVLLGSAYVCTEEAVRAGAIVPQFQQAALACDQTALLESGPGQATRCVPSPFVDEFEQEKRRLLQEDLPPEEFRDRLEILNIGRLRIAAKGVDRDFQADLDLSVRKLREVDEDEQWSRGMYMIGQVAALRDRVVTLAELHEDVSAGSTRRLATAPPPRLLAEQPSPPPAAVAIVGMATILPGAADLGTFWANIFDKVDAITEVPTSRWDLRQYYDPDRAARDKIYSRWGGFLDPVPFDPVVYGMPPNSLPSIEPFQLLALEVARRALDDAGYLNRPFPRQRASVILGAGGGAGDLSGGYVVRSSLPLLFGDSAADLTSGLDGILPEWTEDSFAGILMNVAAGRVANRLDLGGVNYTVDAACASSLAAVYLAVRDLEAHTSEMVIVGGVDALQNPFAYLCFSRTQALSPSGRCRPFDAQADGIAIGEGFAALVLKRLEDAERDGDRIYAVIRGVGGASDGRDRSLTAPRPEGQMLALRRAYAQAGFAPGTVELIEAHGTGTVAGDQAEVQALTRFFEEGGAERQGCAIGSVKSMIGHTKATAGVAGLAKVALALHHRVLPATLGVTEPNPQANFPASPFYVNTETRPWIHGAASYPRRAGVSAFGFGGTDFHIVAEEYTSGFLPDEGATVDQWPAELCIWRGRSRDEIHTSISTLLGKLEQGAQPDLADLAYTLSLQASTVTAGQPTLAIVATSPSDLADKLRSSQALLVGTGERAHTPQGIHYAEHPLTREGQIAFLFPGQGSQYVNMARDLATLFPEARTAFDRADRILAGRLDQPLSRYIFPAPAFTPDEERRQQAALTETNVAQPALGATELALFALLRSLGIQPGMAAGHSYGEFVALWAAGCFGDDVLLSLSEARGRFIREEATGESGTMAAVDAAPEALEELLADPELTVANLNAPLQTVVAGPRAAVERAVAWCEERGLPARLLPVACAFHSPLVAPAQRRLAELLCQTSIAPPRIPVYSNTTASTYSVDPAVIADLLANHLVRPVEFVREIESMYEAGARVFVEVGPRAVLSGLVDRILGDRPHVCAPLDQPGRPGLIQFLQGLATLAAEGTPLQAERLYRDRTVRRLELSRLEQATGQPRYTPTTWLVDGGRARPAHRADGQAETALAPLRVAVLDGSSTDWDRSHPASGGAPTPIERTVNDDSLELKREDGGISSLAPVASSQPNGTSPRPGPTTYSVITPAPASVPAAPLTAGGTASVMEQFQEVMQRFLQTQQAVMLAYLGAAQPGPIAVPSPPTALPGSALPRATLTAPPPVHGDGARAPAPLPPNVPAAAPTPAPPAPEAVSSPLAAPAARPPEAGTPPTREELSERLLAVVSERTGYPTEMLTLDADLEADLGIDSIKRVEIVGNVVRSLALPTGEQPDVEPLTRSRTLRQVIDNLETLIAPTTTTQQATGAPEQPEREVATRPFEQAPAGSSVGRFVPQPVAAPPLGSAATLCRTGAILIVDDENGVGDLLAERLRQQEYRVARIVSENQAPSDHVDALVCPLDQPDEITRLVDQLHERFGPVAALVHLAALRPDPDEIGLDLDRWRARQRRDLESLFLLSQALQADLEQAAANGGAAVLAATALGGSFAFTGDQGPFPGQGGLAGFLKTLGQEWPSVRVKAVDLESSASATAADWLLAELLAADGLVEVGYRADRRTVLELRSAPLPDGAPELPLDSSSVVLITGGARGITAEAALGLAEASQPTLVLIGRTALPAEPESPETAGLSEPQALKRALIEQQRRFGAEVTPAQIEGAYRQLLREREVRENIARLRGTGARVEYFACDVRDPAAFGALIDQVYAAHGRIDGVIHGAGIIEDKLIRDKQLDSFARVVGTKIDSALVLAQKLRPETLRFLVFFSSVSGRFGNRGQGDYAAASEILNKLAQDLDHGWPAHVVSINWGPWLTTGMVTEEVQRQFAERGVALIPIEEGRRKLVEELCAGRKGEVEVLIGSASGRAAGTSAGGPEASGVLALQHTEYRDNGTARISRALPLLTGKTMLRPTPNSGLEVIRTLDPQHDLYLHDHRIDGRPVLPFAVALELVAEVATAAWPELEVAAVRQLRMLRGISLEGSEHTVRLVAHPRSEVPSGSGRSGLGRMVDVAILAAEDPRRIHYQAVVELGPREDGAPGTEAADILASASHLEGAGPLPMSVAEAYRAWMFHGPLFQGITAVEAIGPRGARGLLQPSAPRACLRGEPAGEWLIDPVLIDSALQLHLIWARLHWDVTMLPSRLESYRCFGPLYGDSSATPAPIRCEMWVRPESQVPTSQADFYLYGSDGRLLGALTQMEGTGSKTLNRLAGRNQR